jgi:methionyl-tRNA formyltransferase
LRKLRALFGGGDGAPLGTPQPAPTDLRVVHIKRFETPEGLDALRALSPDLAVVDGTYILKEPVFSLPRFGSVNLHCGRLPDYKGAPPGFWELYNGEPEVGVTVHRVTARLDAGPVLASTTVPIEHAPSDDPMVYVNRLWRESLRREGIRLLCEVAAAVAAGTARARPQGTTTHPTYRFPDWRVVKELRARVRERRATVPRA